MNKTLKLFQYRWNFHIKLVSTWMWSKDLEICSAMKIPLPIDGLQSVIIEKLNAIWVDAKEQTSMKFVFGFNFTFYSFAFHLNSVHKFSWICLNGNEKVNPCFSAVRLIVYITERNKCFDRNKGEVKVGRVCNPSEIFFRSFSIKLFFEMVFPNWGDANPKLVSLKNH